MINYVLINNTERCEFEKKYQLPYGCYNTSIYENSKEAIRLLNNMSNYDKSKYWIEKWDNGIFKELVVKGEWLINN